MNTKKRFTIYLLLLSTSIILLFCSETKSKGVNKKEQNSSLFRDDFDGSQINEDIWKIGTWSEHGGQLVLC